MVCLREYINKMYWVLINDDSIQGGKTTFKKNTNVILSISD